MQLFNLRCYRFLPFIFLLVQCITPNPSRNNNDGDLGDTAQSVVSPLLLDGSNNPIAGSEDGLLEEGQGWPTDGLFDTNAAPPLVIASTDQTDYACPLPPTKESSQRRKLRRADADADACTAPLQQLKPEERTETKPKPGNHDGASKTPGNRISPHSGPSFESAPSWKAPRLQPIAPQKCPDPLLSNPVCAFRTPDMTNWVERQYPGITVDLPECYLLPCFANLEPWCCAIVSLNMIDSEDGSLVLSGTLSGYTCMRMNSFPPNRPSPPPSQHGS